MWFAVLHVIPSALATLLVYFIAANDDNVANAANATPAFAWSSDISFWYVWVHGPYLVHHHHREQHWGEREFGRVGGTAFR